MNPALPRLSRLRGCLRVALLPAWLLGLPGCAPDPPRELVLLGQPGPWPWVSDLVAYGERLWLANSVKHREHNSADLYSFDPGSGSFRYERHLFSQSVGRPLVAQGRLYWPYEDSRFHLGVGLIASTDGRDWTLGAVAAPRLRHLHAVAEVAGRLWLAGSWGAPVLLASGDGGREWKVEHATPDPKGRIDRVLRLAVLGEDLYGYLIAGLRQGERGLVRFQDGALARVPGWPERSEIVSLEAFRGWLYATVAAPEGSELWRTDGARSERVDGAPKAVRSLASDGSEALFALTTRRVGGSVWRSSDGRRWVHDAELPTGLPREIEVYAGEPYVAGRGPRRRGALWGPRSAASPSRDQDPLATPQAPAGTPAGTGEPRGEDADLARESSRERDWPALGARLDRALADPARYQNGARGLIEVLLPMALADPPPGFFTRRLGAGFPAGEVDVLEGRGPPVPLHQLGRWVLLFGISVSGSGPVPASWLRTPWSGEPNEREKYFEPVLGALAALPWTQQRDRVTLQALMDRLEAQSDPDWLRGDVIGALSALTGERFGYDVSAWRSWWRRELALAGEPPTAAPR